MQVDARAPQKWSGSGGGQDLTSLNFWTREPLGFCPCPSVFPCLGLLFFTQLVPCLLGGISRTGAEGCVWPYKACQ